VTHQTINGRVAVERKAYWSKATGTVHPADRWLGIADSRYSVGSREMCCRLASRSSFGTASGDLLRTAQLSISSRTIRVLAETEGQVVQAAHRRGALLASFTAVDCSDGVMVTGADGVFVPVVPETQKAKRRKTEAKKRRAEGRRTTRRPGRPKRGADGEYKEAKVLAFYNQGKSKMHVTATLGDCHELGRMMRRQARQVKLGEADFSYSVADGATWIGRQYDLNLPMLGARILDWYHFKEHVVEASHAVYGEDSPKASIWQEKMLDAAWAQGSLVMLHRLAPYIRRHTEERREALESLRGYVERRTSMTDYPSFRERGYDCGSGPTESQCGTLTSRVKGPGMRWDTAHAESMMALAALQHSQQWKTYWKNRRAG